MARSSTSLQPQTLGELPEHGAKRLGPRRQTLDDGIRSTPAGGLADGRSTEIAGRSAGSTPEVLWQGHQFEPGAAGSILKLRSNCAAINVNRSVSERGGKSAAAQRSCGRRSRPAISTPFSRPNCSSRSRGVERSSHAKGFDWKNLPCDAAGSAAPGQHRRRAQPLGSRRRTEIYDRPQPRDAQTATLRHHVQHRLQGDVLDVEAELLAGINPAINQYGDPLRPTEVGDRVARGLFDQKTSSGWASLCETWAPVDQGSLAADRGGSPGDRAWRNGRRGH